MPDSDLLAELARFIERITAIARTGLAFKPDGFDSERYEELLKEAARMHSVVAGASDDDAETLRRRWREQVIAGYEGYVTAASGCGVIAFNERDEILMLQRPTGKWWYPTGFCDVGISPAEKRREGSARGDRSHRQARASDRGNRQQEIRITGAPYLLDAFLLSNRRR
jgi:hypothetical protein